MYSERNPSITQNYNYLFKFLIIGDVGVGKSAILNQYVNNRYFSDYEPTIGVEFGQKLIEMQNLIIKIQIWDTAGQESFKSITRSYYRGSSAALLVYDITRLQTFINIKIWLQEIKELANQKVCLILVGNKIDKQDKRQVQYQQASDLAKEHGIFFIETSAKTAQNIDLTFCTVSKDLIYKIQLGLIDVKFNDLGIKLGNYQPKLKKYKRLCC